MAAGSGDSSARSRVALCLGKRHSVRVRTAPREAHMSIARLFRPLCALILIPFVTLQVAGQGRGNATPRDPMQEGLPLKPTRTANWTTKVGHWMSVDVSPDGQTLVFDLLGDLYTMPSSGGKATALTR